MDFRLSDEETAVRELARGIFEKEVTAERRKAAEAAGDGLDEALWQTLAEANLLGVAVPEAEGGMGLGLPALCVLLEEAGRAVAPVPLLAALVLGALPLARFGSDAQRRRWLAPLAAGRELLTAALVDAESDDCARPAARARPDGAGGFTLDGEKRLVPLADRAARVLVPATTPEGVAIFLVDPRAEGVALAGRRHSTHERRFDLALSGVRVGGDDVLGDAEAARWLHQAALAALCAEQVGVCEGALDLTARYVRERIQFGVPIGSFQSVQHRAADCWIDLQAMRWTCWRAVTRLAEGRDVSRETAVAKFWAAEGGARIASAAQHLHGGLGSDLDYPIHRYFLRSKALELELGGATPQLARLGRDLARSFPQELA